MNEDAGETAGRRARMRLRIGAAADGGMRTSNPVTVHERKHALDSNSVGSVMSMAGHGGHVIIVVDHALRKDPDTAFHPGQRWW